MRSGFLVLVAVVAIGTSLSLNSQGQAGSTTTAVRTAAVRFALANGLELPSGELVVAGEMAFQLTHVTPPLAGAMELQSQATAISTAIGPSVKSGWAKQLLFCRQIACRPTTNTSVLLIEEPTKRDQSVMSVYIRIYEPSTNLAEYDAVLSQAVVEVEQKDGIWVGVRFRLGPAKNKIKLPGKSSIGTAG